MTPAYQSPAILAQLSQQAETALTEKRFQDAIALCRKILHIDPQSSIAYQTIGKALLATGDLEQAVSSYQEAIALRPDQPELYANLGSVRAQQKQWQEALKCYQKAIELKPDFAGVYRNIARLWERLNQPETAAQAREKAYSLEPETVKPQERLKLGDDFLKLGQTTKAIAHYQRVIEAKPNWLEAYQRLGKALEKAGRWEEATETWKKAMSCSPQTSTDTNLPAPNQELETLKQTCQSYLEQKNWEKAIAAAKQALTIQEDAVTWHLLGKAQQGAQQPQASAQSYRHAIALHPLPESYANLGSLYAAEKQWEKAITHYQAALKIDAQQAGIWRNLARAYSKAGEAEKSALAWYRAYNLAPTAENAQQHLKLGDRLVEHGKIDEAIACYQQAIKQNPQWSLAYSQLGEALKKAGRWEEATESLRKAIESQAPPTQEILPEEKNGHDPTKALLEKAIENDDPQTYLDLTQVYLEQKQWRKAIATARQALMIQPTASAHRWLGKALQGAGESKQAKESYESAIALQPNWADPKVDLADWYSNRKQWRKAIAHYQEALKLDKTHVEAYRGLAKAFKNLGQQAKATEYYYQTLSQESSPETCLELAKRLIQQKKYQEAIACCRQAIALDPNFTQAYHELGTLLVHQGNLAEGIQSYRQALQQNPDSPATWQLLGKALNQWGQQEEAEVSYRQAEWLLTRSQPSSDSNRQISTPKRQGSSTDQALVIQQQAEIALQQGDTETALKHYREAFAYLTGKKNSQETIKIFLFSETETGQLSLDNSGNQSLASLIRLTLVANAFPTFTKGLAWFLEGLAKLKQGNSSSEFSQNGKGKNVNPVIDVTSQTSSEESLTLANHQQSFPSFTTLEAQIKASIEAEDLDRALITCKKLIEYYPQQGEGYKLLGQVYEKQGQLSLALQAYQSAIELRSAPEAIALQPENVELLFSCGKICASLEQWEQAINHYQKALQQNPQRWEIYHYLGDALVASGDTKGAIAAYERAVNLSN